MSRFLPPALLLLLAFPLLPAQDPSVLTLEEAWRMALAANPGEAAARARLEQATARYRQTRAAYQPSLEANASGRRIGTSNTARAANPALDDSAERYDTSLDASFLLWDGGARGSRSDTARASADAASASLDTIRLDLLSNVARAFTAAQLARENLRIARADAEFQNRQLEDIQRREAAGVASRADRLNFDIRRLAAETAATNAEANYAAAMSALAALLGLEAHEPLHAPAPFDPTAPAPEAPSYPDAWRQASDTLPSLREAALRVDAARAATDAARAAYRPSLAAFGTLAATRDDDPAFGGDDFGNTLGLRLSWELWDGGARRERVREADAARREAEAAARQTLLQGQSSLEQALSDYQASVRAEALTRESLTLSRENRDLVEAAYRAGQQSLLRLNEAQRDFTTAEARAVQARLTREQAWIELQRATGDLLRFLP